MTRYVAFLRAINVGGHTVKMERLRSLFEAMSFANVDTFIASGNVLFDSGARKTEPIERRIEQQLRQALGYEVATFVRALPDLAALVDAHPFGDFAAKGHGLYVGFLKDALTAEQALMVLTHQTPVDQFHVGARELYWLRHGNFSDSAVSVKSLERATGAPFTFRKVTTVRTIATMAR